MTETPRTWEELVKISTRPKRKKFFGKIFDPKEFAKKANIIEAPKHNLFIGVERHNEKGVYIPELSWCHEGHSFVWNWYKQLWSVAFGLDGNDGTDWEYELLNKKHYGGSVNSQAYPIIWMNANHYLPAITTNDNDGICLGTDNTPVNESDYWLYGEITHAVGGGAGTLNYGASTGSVYYDSDNKIWTKDISRLFTGNATQTETIAEMVLTMYVYSSQYMITARDLVDPTEDIAVSPATATFHYLLQQEFPA